jgi:hypothetical protein
MSSILETFYFLFDADASKLKKGVEEAEKKTEGLEDKLQDTDAAATRVGGSMLKLATSVGAAIGGFVAFASIKATIHETAMAIDDLADASAALDLRVEDLHAWSLAATMADGSQQGFVASLNTINVGLNAVATKGTGLMLPFLKELGLSMADVKRYSKDPLGAMLAMSDAFSKLSKAEAAGLGSKIGLDQGTINLLAQGRRGVEELIAKQKEMGVITTAQAEAAGKYDEQLKKNAASYDAIKRELVIGVLPSVTWFLETLRKGIAWLAENKNVVVGFFGAAATVLTVAYLPVAIEAAAATWAIVAPFIAVGLAVAAFAAVLSLAVDDLWNYLEGNDSVLGELSKRWPLFGSILRNTVDGIGVALVSLLEGTRAFAAFFVDLITDGPTVAVANLKKTIGDLVDFGASKFPALGDAFGVVGLIMTTTIDGIAAAWNGLIGLFRSGFDFFRNVAGFIGNAHGAAARALGLDWGADDPVAASLRAGKEQIATASATPLASQTSNSIANNRQVAKTTTVNAQVAVHTQATDAEGTARAVQSTLGDQLKYAVDQNDDGVAA